MRAHPPIRYTRWSLPTLLLGCVLGGLLAARADDPPAGSVGGIEGETITVQGPMHVEVVGGKVRTVLMSGSDVRVKSGQAVIELVEGGRISICGPAHFSVLKSGSALTLALDSGTIHVHVDSEPALTVYTAQIQAKPISIGGGAQDLLVGLDGSGQMCLRANTGAVRVEQQLTGQSVIIPQSGDVSLFNGQLETLHTSAGRCACELPDPKFVTRSEVSTLASSEELHRKSVEPKKEVAAPIPVPAQAAAPKEEPVYQVFMPPLQYDAKAAVQRDFDPALIVLVRRARVRSSVVYQGKVEGDAIVAQTVAPPPKPAASGAPGAATQAAAKPTDDSTWKRMKTYIRKLWTPSS